MLANAGETERKRKREERQSHNDAVSGPVEDIVKDDVGGRSTVTVEDREVDEFFAILRRMHTAVGNLKKAERFNGVGKALTEGGRAVRSGDDGNGVNVDVVVREREVVAENVGLELDLNADPVPEPDPV